MAGSDETRVRVVIPARYASRRLPGKLLAEIAGEPLIWHVVCRAREAQVGPVLVAADDPRIVEAVRRRGGEARLVSGPFRNGTERVAAIAREDPRTAVWIDLQGDEPLLEAATIRALAAALVDDPSRPMATVVAPLQEGPQREDPSVVKAVVDGEGRARAFWRTAPPDRRAGPGPAVHVGIYGFRRDALLELAGRPPVEAERIHSLEQLRALAHGVPIHAVWTARAWPSVNTPGDLERVRRLVATASRAAGEPR